MHPCTLCSCAAHAGGAQRETHAPAPASPRAHLVPPGGECARHAWSNSRPLLLLPHSSRCPTGPRTLTRAGSWRASSASHSRRPASGAQDCFTRSFQAVANAACLQVQHCLGQCCSTRQLAHAETSHMMQSPQRAVQLPRARFFQRAERARRGRVPDAAAALPRRLCGRRACLCHQALLPGGCASVCWWCVWGWGLVVCLKGHDYAWVLFCTPHVPLALAAPQLHAHAAHSRAWRSSGASG